MNDRRGSVARWSTDEVEALIDLWALGVPTWEIAEVLGRTEGSIYTARKRFDLRPRRQGPNAGAVLRLVAVNE